MSHLPEIYQSEAALVNGAAKDPLLRVLQLGKGWFTATSGGGLDRVFAALMRYLPRERVEVDGLVVGDEISGTGRATKGVSQNDRPVAERLWAFRKTVRERIEHASYDLIASHFALYAAGVLDLVQSYPHVVHFHGPWAGESQAEGASPLNVKVKAALERRVYGRADRFIVLSEAFGKLLEETYGVAGARIRVVPGGVDVGRFDTGRTREEAREALGWPADRPIILCVRRLAHRMGLEGLTSAMKQVRARLPDALLLIAGTGPLQDALETRIREKELGGHVHLLGFVPDKQLPLAYRAADVSVVPSLRLEGFGLITVESLAAGTPVVVTPVGGLPETVQGLSEHLILPDCSVEALGARLTEVLLGTLPVPGEKDCRAYVREHFDWPVIARRVRSVYEEVL